MKTSDSLRSLAKKPLSWEAEELIAEFERSLRAKETLSLDTAISSLAESERARVLTELACIDLEYAFQAGVKPDVSPFLDSHAEIFTDHKLRAEVAKEHYRLLRVHNVDIDRASVATVYRVDGSGWSDMPLGDGVPSNPFPKVGTEFCGYPLLAELGEGAMGRVYLARQTDLAGRLVVLKVTRQLTGEASELARLQNAGIIPVYSIHQQGGLYAICMPYLGAITLAHLIHDTRVFRRTKKQDFDQCRQLASTLVNLRFSTIVSTFKPTSELASASSSQTDALSSVGGANLKDFQSDTGSSSTFKKADQLQPEDCGSNNTGGGVKSGEGTLASLDSSTLQNMLGLGELADSIFSNILSQKPLDAKVNVMLGIVRAVAHAHRQKIVHHDLKPENILIANNGQPVLLDFNLAQSDKAVTAVAGGTIPYMSAQHLQALTGSIKAAPANDVFSLGVIFYQLITGKLPYPGNDPKAAQRLIQNRQQPPKSARELDYTVPPSLNSIISKCLAFESADRYPSAVELEVDMARFAENLPLKFAPDRSPVERLQKWTRRHPLLTSNFTLSLVAIVLITALGFSLLANKRRAASLEMAEQVRVTFNKLPETLAMLRSPGIEPELLGKGLDSGLSILAEVGQRSPNSQLNSGKQDLQKLLQALEPRERDSLTSQLADLYFAMAGAQAELAAQGNRKVLEDANGNLQSAIEKATRWNSLAASLSQEFALPVQFQAQRIASLTKPNDKAKTSQNTELASKLDNASTYAQMLAAHERGEVAQWSKLADKLVSERPTDPKSWFSLASARLATGEIRSALSAMDVAARLQPDSSTSVFWRGVLRLKNNEFSAARDDFTFCIAQQESLYAARYNRALAQKSLGENQAALKDLDWLVENQYKTPRVFSLRSQLQVLLNNIPGARADIQSALGAKPVSTDDWVSRGVLKISTDARGALADFSQALRTDPSNLAAHFNSAHVHSEVLGDVPAAVESMNAIVNSGQQSASVLASRGILLARIQKFDEARRDAQAAVGLQPSALEMLQIAGIYSMISKDDADLQLAATWLARSIAANADMKSLADGDPDLAKLRGTNRYRSIMQ